MIGRTWFLAACAACALVMLLLTAVVGITLDAARSARLELGAAGWITLAVFLAALTVHGLWVVLFRYRPAPER